MSEETITDDQSHYEVSLTAGQAFLAFVLLLLSLAASFAFGLMIGRGQGDERMLAQAAPGIVEEPSAAPATRKPRQRIVELAMSDDAPAARPDAPAARPMIREEAAPPPAQLAAKPKPAVAKPAVSTPALPHYAQLLSTSDPKKAEGLAAKLIEGGFLSAYVDRATTEKGQLYRVRVNFPSLEDARAAESKLKSFSNEVWITKQ